MEIKKIVNHFEMAPHPEGGFSSLLFEDTEIVQKHGLPEGFNSSRPFWNAIYYLLPNGDRSIFHKLKMPEMWNFYLGGSLELFDLSPDGKLKKIILGQDILNGEQLSYVIPKKHWIGAKPSDSSPFSLVSCVTCPGFTFDDWERGNRNNLINLCPDFKDIIAELT